MRSKILIVFLAAFSLSQGQAGWGESTMAYEEKSDMEYALLGGGCFWCREAVFERIPGIKEVVSGYAGGQKKNPSYEEVCTGETGHAEVVRIEYDASLISYKEILDLFFRAHDPTTLNRQGADMGTQYRSVILYRNEGQKKEAQEAAGRAGRLYRNPVVTQIVPWDVFYPAEGYHQDYYDRNPFAGYCRAVIRPKLEKLDLAPERTR